LDQGQRACKPFISTAGLFAGSHHRTIQNPLNIAPDAVLDELEKKAS
jgi:hypothetical protein